MLSWQIAKDGRERPPFAEMNFLLSYFLLPCAAIRVRPSPDGARDDGETTAKLLINQGEMTEKELSMVPACLLLCCPNIVVGWQTELPKVANTSDIVVGWQKNAPGIVVGWHRSAIKLTAFPLETRTYAPMYHLCISTLSNV
jgi:hypothetical protein